MSMRIEALTAADVALIVMALAVLAGRLDQPGQARCLVLAGEISDSFGRLPAGAEVAA